MAKQKGIRFLVVRDAPRTNTGLRSEWLSGLSDRATAREEAQSLVDDPMDCIVRILLWDERLEQFAGVVRKRLTN